VLAIGLLSSVFLFVSSSARDMTQRTIATVPVDMRAQALTYGLDTQAAGKALLRQKGVLAVQPLTMSHFSGSSATRAGQTTSTASGPILPVNSAYFTTFPAIRIVQGHFGSSGIVVSQDMGSNLGVRIGDTVTLRLPGRGGPYRAHVIGIANMKKADILFAPTDPLLAGAAYNPPANVVIMPLSVFDARLAARLSKAPPPPEPTTTGGPVAPIVQTSILPVDRELHIRIDRAALPGDPTQAQSQTSLLRLALEKLYPGELRVTDNLFAAIETVKNDVLWAQILFVFLAIPGVLLAGYLSRYAAEALVEQQRREFALLRARGASGEQIIQIVAVMSFAIGLIGSILGLVAGVITCMALFGTQLFALSNWRLWGSAFLWCLLAGLVISGLSTFLPVRRTLRQEITGERQVAQRSTGRPLWTRLYLDVAALIAALVVYRVTQSELRLNVAFTLTNTSGEPGFATGSHIFDRDTLTLIDEGPRALPPDDPAGRHPARPRPGAPVPLPPQPHALPRRHSHLERWPGDGVHPRPLHRAAALRATPGAGRASRVRAPRGGRPRPPRPALPRLRGRRVLVDPRQQ